MPRQVSTFWLIRVNCEIQSLAQVYKRSKCDGLSKGQRYVVLFFISAENWAALHVLCKHCSQRWPEWYLCCFSDSPFTSHKSQAPVSYITCPAFHPSLHFKKLIMEVMYAYWGKFGEWENCSCLYCLCAFHIAKPFGGRPSVLPGLALALDHPLGRPFTTPFSFLKPQQPLCASYSQLKTLTHTEAISTDLSTKYTGTGTVAGTLPLCLLLGQSLHFAQHPIPVSSSGLCSCNYFHPCLTICPPLL